MSEHTPPMRLAVLASGGGSNLQALVEYFASPGARLAATVVLVASDRPGAGALAKALSRNIPAAILENSKDGPGIVKLLESHHVEMIVLAGYLRLVPAEVLRRWSGRIVNIHPALLPKFGGKGMYGRRVHEAVIAAGEGESGATVHHVTDEYDRGLIIAQESVPVVKGDTPDSLAARVLEAEHRLYPQTVHQLALSLQLSTPTDR